MCHPTLIIGWNLNSQLAQRAHGTRLAQRFISPRAGGGSAEMLSRGGATRPRMILAFTLGLETRLLWIWSRCIGQVGRKRNLPLPRRTRLLSVSKSEGQGCK